MEGVDVAAEGKIHTSVAASAPEAPSAVVASRAAAVFSMSQRDAMTNAIIASAPYSSVVTMTAMSSPLKAPLVTNK